MSRVEGTVSHGERGLTMRTVGWILLVFDACIIAMFVFVGIRNGSDLWFYWAVVQGIVGVGLVLAGLRQIDIASSVTGHSVEPHLHAGEIPADEHPRAA